jgi:hypothetical protein
MKYMQYRRAAGILFSIITAFTLHGCMVAALAPLAPMVGGLAPSTNSVVINQATITPEIRQAFASAKTITLLGGDKSDVYMAEYMDEQRAFDVRIEQSNKVSTPSQRREDMRKICTKDSPPDLVLSSSLGNSDAGTGTTVTAMFTGRASYNVAGTIDVLRCKDGWAGKFGITAEISQGMYNADQTKLNQILGQEVAKALINLGGKSITDANGKQIPNPANSQSGVTNPIRSVESTPPVAASTTESRPMTVAQAQASLKAQGYAISQIDGVMGPKTRSELKRFQKSRGIHETGELDAATSAALR